jgi:hypothetical protein
MRFATVLILALLASRGLQAAHAADIQTDATAAATTGLLKSLKQALDTEEFFKDAFWTDDNLKHFFNAPSIEWLNKDDKPPLGQVARLKSASLAAADIQISHLVYPKDTGHGPQMRFCLILVKGLALTKDQVTTAFGTLPAPGPSEPGTLQYGDPPASHSRWDGVSRKGVTFTLGTDGSVRLMVSNGVRPNPQ